jgi:hypothetical protein
MIVMAQAIVMIGPVEVRTALCPEERTGKQREGEGERKEGEGNELPDGLHYLNSFVPCLLHLRYRESERVFVCANGGEERGGGSK